MARTKHYPIAVVNRQQEGNKRNGFDSKRNGKDIEANSEFHDVVFTPKGVNGTSGKARQVLQNTLKQFYY
jgi:hypothetical protein